MIPVIASCPICKKEFKPKRKKGGLWTKCCSFLCGRINFRGHIPWNRGKKGVQVGWSKGLNKHNHPGIMRVSLSKMGKNNPMWKGGLGPNEGLRNLIYRDLNKPKICQRCDSKNKIHLHHIDENRDNNTPENIEILCSKCHRTEHAKRHWAAKTDSCLRCGTNQYHHESRGLCIICYRFCLRKRKLLEYPLQYKNHPRASENYSF